jgi:hypothetical protein
MPSHLAAPGRTLHFRPLAALASMLFWLPVCALAQSATVQPLDDFFQSWSDRVSATQAAQPGWMTPLVTVTPRLEQEFRYDQYIESLPNGGHINDYDTGKGLELIPTSFNEVILGLPQYIDHTGPKAASGWGDWPFLLIKTRLFSENAAQGDGIVTFFLQGQAPLRTKGISNNTYLVTPTLAAGKGFGDFDVQGTLGFALPTGDVSTIGHTMLGNVAFQYHLLDVLWPEFEVNWTRYLDGEHGARNQVFLTPGVVFGRFPLGHGLKLSLGLGYQIAVSPHQEATSSLPAYRNNGIVSVRLSF